MAKRKASAELVLTPTPPEVATPEVVATVETGNGLLAGLFFFGLFAVLYVTKELVLPLLLAFLFSLLLQPVMKAFDRVRIPRVVGSMIVIAVIFAAFSGLGVALSGPITEWAERMHSGLPKLEQRLSALTEYLRVTQSLLDRAERVAEEAVQATPVTVKDGGFSFAQSVFRETGLVLGGFFTTLLMLFFFLISGDLFLRRLVEILPGYSDKRQAVEIARTIQSDLSVYIVTISAMNFAVGVATGLAAYFCGLGDPLLWGMVAFLLNYVLVVGPFIGVGLFLIAGYLSFDSLGMAFLPAILYVAIHLLEAQVATPLLLARRFTLNPVLVILSIVFWLWMWGALGAILAVPILALTKIVCDRSKSFAAFGRFLEG